MSRYQFYKTTTWALLILNLLMLAVILFPALRPPHPPSRKDARKFRLKAVEMLALAPEQEEVFKQTARAHAQSMRKLNQQQEALLSPYFQSLIDPLSPSEEDSLITEIQALEREKIVYTRQHFEEVRAILGPDQQENYQEFIQAALSIILDKQRFIPPPTKKNPPPPKDLP